MPAPSRRAATRRRGLLLLALVLAVLGLAGFGLVAAEDGHGRDDSEAATLRLAQAGAQAAFQQMQRSLEGIATLHALARLAWLSRLESGHPDPGGIEAQLADFVEAQRFGVLQVAVIGVEGLLGWSTVPGFGPVDLSDREHFRVHQAGRLDSFVSAPLIGRASGRPSLNISRPVLSPNGAFAGVTVVSLDPLMVSATLADLQFTEGAAAALLRTDGTVLARSAESARYMGTRRQGVEDTAALQSMAGATLMDSPVSGRRVFLAWRRIPDWPLVVTFGIDADAALADHREAVERLRLLHGAVLLATGLAGLLLVELMVRRRARQDAEKAEAARAEIASLLDALPGAAYRGEVDAAGSFTRRYLSPAASRITGWPEPWLAGSGALAGLMEPEARAAHDEFFRTVLRDGQHAAEYRLRTGGGGSVWVSDQCRLLRRLPDGGAEVVGLIADITAEQQIKAQALSAAKLATLGEMATGVAHELSQPCAAITLAADIAALELQRGGADRTASAGRRLEEIARQASRMRDIIDHFRVFGRRDEATEEEVEIAAVVAGALTVSTGTLKASGVRVALRLADALPHVRGRAVPLEQVLINLLGNARDAMEAMPTEARRVEVTATRDADPQFVRLAVRDHGTGIPRAILDRVFEPFFTSKPVGKGTGLGLSIAYGTLRSFGGSIEARNAPGGGAEFILRLAVARPPARDTEAPA